MKMARRPTDAGGQLGMHREMPVPEGNCHFNGLSTGHPSSVSYGRSTSDARIFWSRAGATNWARASGARASGARVGAFEARRVATGGTERE